MTGATDLVEQVLHLPPGALGRRELLPGTRPAEPSDRALHGSAPAYDDCSARTCLPPCPGSRGLDDDLGGPCA